PLADIACTLATRRSDAVRAAVVAHGRDELVARLEAIARAAEAGAAPEGGGAWLFLGGEEAPPLALLFPGQGAQAPDLCRDLFDRFPAFRARLEELAAAAEPVLGRPLLPILYPAADEAARARAAEELRRTEVTQPALAAVELALAGFLAELGIEPAVLVGHSLGE